MKLIPTLLLLASSPFALAANLTTVYQYPNGTWLENIARTYTSQLLVSLIGSPSLYIVDPTVSPATSALLTTFPDANSVLGITEFAKDVFAVAVGTLNTSNNTPELGSFAIWRVELGCAGEAVHVEKIVDVHDMGMPNGLATVHSNMVLVADSWNGNIVAVDIAKKTYEVVLEDATLRADFSGKESLPFGVNGVRFHKHTNTLYYTNTVQNLLGRVHIDPTTAAPKGPFTTIAKGEHISQPDDFAVRDDGSVILARPVADEAMHIGADGDVEEVAKGGLASGATSVVLGKGGEVFLSESGLVGGMRGGGGRVVRMMF